MHSWELPSRLAAELSLCALAIVRRHLCKRKPTKLSQIDKQGAGGAVIIVGHNNRNHNKRFDCVCVRWLRSCSSCYCGPTHTARASWRKLWGLATHRARPLMARGQWRFHSNSRPAKGRAATKRWPVALAAARNNRRRQRNETQAGAQIMLLVWLWQHPALDGLADSSAGISAHKAIAGIDIDADYSWRPLVRFSTISPTRTNAIGARPFIHSCVRAVGEFVVVAVGVGAGRSGARVHWQQLELRRLESQVQQSQLLQSQLQLARTQRRPTRKMVNFNGFDCTSLCAYRPRICLSSAAQVERARDEGSDLASCSIAVVWPASTNLINCASCNCTVRSQRRRHQHHSSSADNNGRSLRPCRRQCTHRRSIGAGEWLARAASARMI